MQNFVISNMLGSNPDILFSYRCTYVAVQYGYRKSCQRESKSDFILSNPFKPLARMVENSMSPQSWSILFLVPVFSK